MKSAKEYIQNILDTDPFTPLWQAVYSYLKREIITLRMAPGDKLTESQIAVLMDISRSPIRRALEQLSIEGLAKKDDSNRYRVSHITKKDLQNLVHARIEIDGQAAKIAAKMIQPPDLSEMAQLLNQFRHFPEDISFYEFAIIDDHFHKIIYRACGNPYIQSMYAIIRPSLLRYRYFSMAIYPDKKELYQSTYITHNAIYHALKNHFSEVAKAEAQQDASRILDTIALIPDTVNYDIFKKLDNSCMNL